MSERRHDGLMGALIWIVGFVVVTPVLLVMLAGEWMFGWLTEDEPKETPGSR